MDELNNKKRRTDNDSIDTPKGDGGSCYPDNDIIQQLSKNGNSNDYNKDNSLFSQSGITLLGHTPNDQYVFYKNGKVYVKDVNKFGTKNIQIFFGVSDTVAKKISKQLPLLATDNEVDTDNTISNGIFKLYDNEDNTSGKTEFTIINGTDPFKLFYTIDGYRLIQFDSPIVNGRLIDLGASTSWLNIHKFNDALHENAIDMLFEQFSLLARALDNLQLQDDDAVNYLASFIMLAPFHTIMSWRPYVWITGNRGSGKTMLFERIMQQLYKGLVVRLDNSTDYGAIQMLSGNGCIPLFDNFEPSFKAQHLMRNFEIASRGGNYVRGTTGSKARIYSLNHMPWFGSVIVVPETGATDSRIVEFKLTGQPRNALKLPARVSAERIIAGIINLWDDIESLRNLYVNWNKDNGRAAENVGYAHSLLQLMEVVDPEDMTLPTFISQKSQVNEGLDVLRTIFKSSILTDTATDSSESSKKQVCDALIENGRSIIRKGLWTVIHNNEQYVAVDPELVVENILKYTRYKSYSPKYLEKILLNVKGVFKTVVSCEGRGKARRILVPIDYIDPDAIDLEE